MEKSLRIFIVLILFINITSVFGQINVSHFMNSGREKLMNKEYLPAIEIFNFILRFNPDEDEAYYFRAISKFELGDSRGAIDDLSKAIELRPYISYYYGYYFVYRGMAKEKLYNFKGAWDDYNKAVDIRPFDTEPFILRGTLFLRIKKYDEAINDFNSAIELRKNNADAFVGRGVGKRFKAQYEDAMADFNKAIKMNPHNPYAYIERGRTHYEMKSYTASIDDYTKAIQIDSLNSFVYFNRALAKYEIKDFDGAMSDFNKVIVLDPVNALTYFNRAELKARRNDFKGAIADYNKVLSINPQNVFSYFNRAIMWQRLENYQKAIADYTAAINLNPLFATAYYNRSIARSSIKDYIGAEADYKAAANLNASLSTLSQSGKLDSTGLARLIELKANFDEGNANAIQSSVTELLPFYNYKVTYCFHDSLQNSKSPFLKELKEIDQINNEYSVQDQFMLSCRDDSFPQGKAEEIMKSTDTTNNASDHFMKLFRRAIIKSFMQDYNGSLDDYNNLISQKPTFLLAYFNRANVRYEMLNFIDNMNQDNSITIGSYTVKDKDSKKMTVKNYDEVVNDYTKCIQLNPNFYYAYFNLANLNLDFHNYIGAIGNYNKAIDLEPKLAEAYYNRGLTYIYIQKKEEGCIDLSKAGELGIEKAYTVIKKYCDH